jgi:hypothetical protein
VSAPSVRTEQNLLHLHPLKKDVIHKIYDMDPQAKENFFSTIGQHIMALSHVLGIHHVLNFKINYSTIYNLIKNHITTAEHIILNAILQTIISVRIIILHLTLQNDPKAKNYTRITRPNLSESVNSH